MIAISLSVIFLGTLLLSLPIAVTESIGWMEAFFTATSAFTVTGLAVVNTGTAFTLFGQLVILTLIKLGGIGIMTFAVLAFIMIGKKIGLKERIMVQQALNQNSLGGVIKLARNIFIYSTAIELIAMIILAIRWIPIHGVSRGLYHSLFHAISAFNNAGFSLYSDSLVGYARDPIVNLVITSLFIIGGLGFTVLIDLKNKKCFKWLSLHSKVMIIGTLAINLVAMLVFMALEYQNPETLGAFTRLDHQMLASYFQATTTRTAGFNTLVMNALQPTTLIFMSLLMFIGAGSASTGGGIKLTTFLVVCFSSLTFVRGRKQITIGNRTLKEKVIIRAFAVLTISSALVFLSFFILTLTESLPISDLFFEVVSAFGTVGLSTGITGDLSFIGRLIIICLMFFGKIGPLTLAFSLARSQPDKIQYPSEDVLTG